MNIFSALDISGNKSVICADREKYSKSADLYIIELQLRDRNYNHRPRL